MNPRIRLGVLTPSSNTALEPLTTAVVAGIPECSVHFSRFKVTEIALSPQALGQLDVGIDTRRIQGWGLLFSWGAS